MNELVLHPSTQKLAEKISQHLPHGLVIEGPIGSGVLAVAKALAKEAGARVFTLSPKKKIKGEFIVDPAEGSVVIDDIRALYEQTRTRQSERHVYIIDTGLKSMTQGAQNAFLKLLEEPRDGVHFIIATHQVDQLLPTILSRVQRLPLLPVTAEQVTKLIDSLGIQDDTKRTRLAFVGSGLPALIKRLAADNDTYEARVTIMRDAKTMLGANTYEKMAIIHRYRESRSDTLTLLDDMNHQLRIILRSQPSTQLAAVIDTNLEARAKIAAGGNIRLHLASCVL